MLCMPLKRERIRVVTNEGKLAERDKTVLAGKGQLNSDIGAQKQKSLARMRGFFANTFAFVRQEPRLT
jgi:hypothetical protein